MWLYKHNTKSTIIATLGYQLHKRKVDHTLIIGFNLYAVLIKGDFMYSTEKIGAKAKNILIL